MNFLHNDVKTENVLIDKEVVYLIDFGLATKYMGTDGNHVPEKSLSKFNGNFMFTAMN